MSKLAVIVCRVGEFPIVERIDSDLAAMQKIVGGHVECVRLSGTSFTHGIDLWCDEEFLFKDYAPNRMVSSDLIIHGDFFIAAHDGKGATIGLTTDEQERWLRIVADGDPCLPRLDLNRRASYRPATRP